MTGTLSPGISGTLSPEYSVGDPIRVATAGKGNLNREKLKQLYHRQVKLYPDLGAYKKWQTIAAGNPNITGHHPQKMSHTCRQNPGS